MFGRSRQRIFRSALAGIVTSNTRVKDGEVIVEVTVPGNGRRVVNWEVRPPGAV